MSEELRRWLLDEISSIEGLRSLLITDRDGVPLLRVGADLKGAAAAPVPESSSRPGHAGTFALAVDQGGKLGLGGAEALVCDYGRHQLVQLNAAPLIVTFVVGGRCCTGRVLELGRRIVREVVGELRGAVVVAEG